MSAAPAHDADSLTRWTRTSPCPVCGGHDGLARGKGQRCHGFLSGDGEYAHCTREELAGAIRQSNESETYGHRLRGPCKCGTTHGEAPQSSAPPRIVGTYDYTDESGTVLFQVVRMDPKGFKQRRPDGLGGWTWGIKGARRVLYHLPEVLEAIAAGVTIYIAEGEKDVEAMRSASCVATCNPMGAGKKVKPYAEYFRDAEHVVIVADKDEKGRKHARAWEAALRGVAKRVEVVEPVKGKDAHDALVTHGFPIAEAFRVAAEKEESEITEPLSNGAVVEMLTELGNARRLVVQHGRDLRHVPGWGTWILWNGKHWERDATGEVMRRAKQTARAILVEAAGLEDADARGKVTKHALKSETKNALKAMVELATTEPGIPVRAAELDADPWLLNCQNGTLNLRSGVLQAHQREDLATKITAVEFEPDACCPVFVSFLDRVMPKYEMQSFLRRAAGKSLIGDVREEVFFFAYGPPASGKSTFLEAVKSALGDYAATADFETFLQRRDSGGPRSDIARLAGTRLVASVEVDDGKRLAAGLVKTLTGGDTITVRGLYQSEIEYRPQFSLWLAANDEPTVRDDDAALWRRLHELPFEESIPEEERDPAVKATVVDPKGSGPAVLAWAVAGCRDYLENGLRPPEAVKRATADYRARMDPLAEWMHELLVCGPRESATAAELYASYLTHAEASGVRLPMKRSALGKRLSSKGFKPEKDEHHTRYGIGVRK